MELEGLAQILIYTHATFGGIALITGGVAIVAKKGKKIHKKSGKVFFYTMLISAMISFVISFMPNHQSAFLFSVGIFSTYFLLTGYRSLKFKNDLSGLKTAKVIAYAIILTGFCMVVLPVFFQLRGNVVLLVFGIMCLIFGIRDLRLFKDTDKLKKSWLKLHLGNMTGGYIAAVSAFFVVNRILPGIWNWFVPGIVGGAYITYWMIKLDKKKGTTDSK